MHQIIYLFHEGEYLALMMSPLVLVKRVFLRTKSAVVNRTKFWFLRNEGDLKDVLSFIMVIVDFAFGATLGGILCTLVADNAIIASILVLFLGILLMHLLFIVFLDFAMFLLANISQISRKANYVIDQADYRFSTASSPKRKTKKKRVYDEQVTLGELLDQEQLTKRK